MLNIPMPEPVLVNGHGETSEAVVPRLVDEIPSVPNLTVPNTTG